MNRLWNEPVLIGTAIRAIIYAAMMFGAKVTTEQLAALMVAVEAVLALVTRALVTPNALAEARVDAGLRPTQKLSALLLCMLIGSQLACAGNAAPNLSPEGKAAFYGERFMAQVEAAQQQTIALVGQFGITKTDVTPVIEGFVTIGKGGQELAAALKIIDESNVAATQQSAAVRVRTAVTAFSDVLNELTVRVGSEILRARITAIVQTLKLGAALFDVMQRIAPFLPKPVAFHMEVTYATS